ncbi:hypothetical protein MRB53_014705 [Persea americana]|uniref:Uncharacterized protein n=1 Tax=Persea americana TaxID=3435 RepID=A0ACC2KBJ1_PERAE|nr:hypothetical protein MRB53_014705 [Persea americana]
MFSDSSPNATSLFTIVVSFLLFNTVGALIRMREDIRQVTFTISFSVLLLVFFSCVSVFEKLPQDSKKKKRLKIPIWLLYATLNSMFAYRFWTIIQPGMALGWLVWGMGGTSSLITFYFFFLYTDKKSRPGECDSMALCAEQV